MSYRQQTKARVILGPLLPPEISGYRVVGQIHNDFIYEREDKMIQISGHWVNPEHVSAVHVVERKGWSQRHWRKWEIEVRLSSGHTFLDWPHGSDSLAEAEENRNSLARYINSKLSLDQFGGQQEHSEVMREIISH